MNIFFHVLEYAKYLYHDIYIYLPTEISYKAQNIIYAFQLLTSEKLNSALPKNSPVLEIRKKEVGADRKYAFEDFKRAQTLNECPSSLSSLRFTHLHHHTHILNDSKSSLSNNKAQKTQ